MTLSSVQRIAIAVGLPTCAFANATVAFAYTGKLVDCLMAGAWAAAPFVVLWWWSSPKSDTSHARITVFGTVLVSVLFGAALFIGRIWGGVLSKGLPETNMFPVAAPVLLLAIVFALMLVSTFTDIALSRFKKSDQSG